MGAEQDPDGDGGGAALHPQAAKSSRLVAPATRKELNTFRPGLFPLACWRLNDVRFDFDSSFIRPDAEKEVKLLSQLLKLHPGAPLAVFGHADPVGDDDYNKKLSGRRATAVYALLTRRTDLWEDLFKHPFGGDAWGLRSLQRMLGALGHFTGTPSGVAGSETARAVRSFQRAKGLDPDGDPGPATREALFADYMDLLCSPQLRLAAADFLARGASPDGKGDFQGCGEFNPILRFSRSQEARFARQATKTERNDANAPNRRVVVFLFAPDSRVDSGRWPCPSVAEGPAACRRRFWSDHEAHATPTDAERHYETDRDTFRCRFYDRMASRSPCESLRPIVFKTWIRLVVRDAATGEPVPGVAVTIQSAAGETFALHTDADGGVMVDGIAPGPARVTSSPEPGDKRPAVLFASMGAAGVKAASLAPTTTRVSKRSAAKIGQALRIAVHQPAEARAQKLGFVSVNAKAKTDEGAKRDGVAPFERDGLPTGMEHEIRVTALDVLAIELRDEHGFPIPEAAFEVTLADGSVERGQLDREGRGEILNPPEGPYEVRYTDLDDVKAKSLAGRARKACDTRDADEFLKVLLYSPELVEAAAQAYRTFFDSLSGQGMAEDIQNALEGSERLLGVQFMMMKAGLPTRVQFQLSESARPPRP